MTSTNKDNISQRQYICPILNENFPKISLMALGILGQMINVPELDYCTIDKLYNNNILDSIADITDAVEELIDNNCVIKLCDKRLAVNKNIIVNMKLKSGSYQENYEE